MLADISSVVRLCTINEADETGQTLCTRLSKDFFDFTTLVADSFLVHLSEDGVLS